MPSEDYHSRIKFIIAMAIVFLTCSPFFSITSAGIPTGGDSYLEKTLDTGSSNVNNIIDPLTGIASPPAILPESSFSEKLTVDQAVLPPLVPTTINLTSGAIVGAESNQENANPSEEPIINAGSFNSPLQNLDGPVFSAGDIGITKKDIGVAAAATITSVSILKYIGIEQVLRRLREIIRILPFIPARYEHVSEGLANETRDRINQYIVRNPGVHMRAIALELKIPMGTLRYHLNVLEDTRKISSMRHWGFKRYYPNIKKYEEKIGMLAAFKKATSRDILHLIKHNQGICRSEIAGQLKISGPAVTWHVFRLKHDNLIRVSREGRLVRYYLTDQALQAEGYDEKQFTGEGVANVSEAV